jgi:hypothetical protein
LTAKALKIWLGVVVGLGAVSLLGFALWRRYSTALAGANDQMHMVDGKRWVRGHSPAAAGYKQIACKSGIPGLHCWTSPARLGDAGLDIKMAKQSLKEERGAITAYGRRLKKAGSTALKKALHHARAEERQHAAAFKRLVR